MSRISIFIDSRNQKTVEEYKNIYQYDLYSQGRFINTLFFGDKNLKGKRYIARNLKFTTARQAALALDKKLIEDNQEPINILKRKYDK